MLISLAGAGAAAVRLFRPYRAGLRLSFVGDDTIQVSPGCATSEDGHVFRLDSDALIGFEALDTGAREAGRDYAVFATPAGIRLTAITTYHSGGLAPVGFGPQECVLLGYFHNGKDYEGGGADGAIFEYSVCSNDLLDMAHPYRAHKELPAGVPLPGMVKVGNLAIGIYPASHEDATASVAGNSFYPTSRYGVVPWTDIQGWTAMQVVAQAGCRLPSWAEWLMASTFNPLSTVPARMNGNTYYGSASDDAYLSAPGAPTAALAGLGPGNLNAGVYKYRVTFVNVRGETQGGAASANVTVVDPGTDGQISLTAIPTGAAGTTARKIYRTVAGGATYKYVATLADNETTAYTDNIADASLGAAVSERNTTGVQQGANDPTNNQGRTLVGTGPRTQNWGAVGAGRSWYSPAGLADCVGNIWEWVAQFFGGLKTSSPGSYVGWGSESDGMWNLQGQAFNPDTGGWTEGLPAMLLVGGDWDYGSLAGVRAAYAYDSPGYAYWSIGFRLAR